MLLPLAHPYTQTHKTRTQTNTHTRLLFERGERKKKKKERKRHPISIHTHSGRAHHDRSLFTPQKHPSFWTSLPPHSTYAHAHTHVRSRSPRKLKSKKTRPTHGKPPTRPPILHAPCPSNRRESMPANRVPIPSLVEQKTTTARRG